ncbi:iron complex transport system ATP-binding protein [Actinoalloteichus hoggarensis]|uniref:Hemin import ATP-binding protein HmuV n=1 Tax=Actinoalloteichus hoggarensis TaxID=1470176 RepID=A0A221W5P3_9PSEU|nr:ABC transporter ATP-binding protein [Actinoalloteichus hoggarensis]ASO21033.1 Hemin import ATP-binding protein HmuV [Actinoalloteichus hoggarensis]MBB5920964.1 iron complex transport system ATP-binding protein [Actinoalloteichus hoggarensis]
MRLTLDAVSVEIAGRTLVRELRLAVENEEIVGLIGPNGSGKSTALRCVYRALRPTAGAVLLDDVDLAKLTLRQSARSVAALTQEASTDLDFTVREVVALGRAPHLRDDQALDAREEELCAAVMRRADVAHLADRSILTLSGGERQRVYIARALAQEPQVLVLDEPTNHLDVRHQIELLSFLRTAGLTVLIALHDMNLAAAACDRIGVLSGGELVAVGKPGEVLTPELMHDVFGVAATVVSHPVTGTPQLLYELTEHHPEGTRT